MRLLDLLETNITPLVGYHGTAIDKDEFRRQGGAFGVGAYFSPSFKDALDYAMMDSEVDGDEPIVIQAELLFQNPYHRTDAKTFQSVSPKRRDELEAAGYDSMIGQYPNGQQEYVAFDPRQVKIISKIRGHEALEKFKSSLREDVQPSLIQSPQFRAWFKQSKVVDQQGNPLVVFHGTPSPLFDKFENRKGFTTFMGIPVEVQRHGFYFAENEAFAREFVNQPRHRGKGGVIPVYLSIQNPLRITYEAGIYWKDVQKLAAQGVDMDWMENYIGNPQNTWEFFDDKEGEWFVQAIKAAGFDGVMFEENNSSGGSETVWLAFYPNQIKRAIQSGFNPQRDVIHESWDNYQEIGHYRGAKLWYLLKGGKLIVDDVGYMMVGATPEDFESVSDERDGLMNHNPEIEENTLAVGRIDDLRKKISIRTPLAPGNSYFDLPERTIEFAAKKLRQQYPEYEIWYFGKGASEIRQIMEDERLHYFDIGHHRGGLMFYVMPGGKLKTVKDQGVSRSMHNPDEAGNALAVGRIDDRRKMISIRDPDDRRPMDEHRLDYVHKVLRRAYPEYRIYFFRYHQPRLLEDQPVQDRYYWEDQNTAQFRIGPYDFEARFLRGPFDPDDHYFRVWRVIGKRPQGGTGLFPKITEMLKRITLEFIQRVKPAVLEINGEDAKRNEFNAKNYAGWTPQGYRFELLKDDGRYRMSGAWNGIRGVAFVRDRQ